MKTLGFKKILTNYKNIFSKETLKRLDKYIMDYYEYTTVHIAVNNFKPKAYFKANLDERFKDYLDPDILKYKLELR